MARPTRSRDGGFTLVELLVVIIVLGVLATITVLAVRGIVDQGEETSQAADQHVLVTAEEAHMARFNTYADEDTLVTAGLLTAASTQHDITLIDAGDSYTIVPAGSGTTTATTVATEPGGSEEPTPSTLPPTAVPTTFAGFSGQSFGAGPNRIVVITDGTKMASGWEAFVAAGVPLADTEMIFLNAGVNSTADVDAIVAAGATYLVAAESVPITRPGGGTTYVGQYLYDSGLRQDDFWWGHSQGSFNEMLERFR